MEDKISRQRPVVVEKYGYRLYNFVYGGEVVKFFMKKSVRNQ